MRLRSVCLIAGGMSPAHSRLQPWRYLHEIAHGLAALGHRLLLVSDGKPDGDMRGDIQICRLASIRNALLLGNKDLQELLRAHHPEVILQHISLLSFLHQNFHYLSGSGSAGIFTSPIYTLNNLVKLGPGRLLRRLPLTGAHLVGSCLPGWFIRERIERSQFNVLAVQTQTTRQQLRSLGVRKKPVAVIPPGVDPYWIVNVAGNQPAPGPPSPENEATVTFVYFGPAEQLRGFDTLLTAFSSACAQDPFLRLQVLVRQDGGAFSRRENYLEQGVTNQSPPFTRIDTQSLSSSELAARVAAADAVVLPFELVSSDAPLSLLETVALGMPLVTTPVACLPELAGPLPHFFARPCDPGSLNLALLQAAGYVRETRRNSASPGNAPPGQARSWQEVAQAWSSLVQSL